MTHSLMASRKRTRDCEEECCVPLSKRINNLHINPCCNGNHAPEVSITQEQHVATQAYQPALDATQNPHYYEHNRLLYELYIERTHRSTLA